VWQGETVGSVRSRLQERLGLPDKEWDKYRIATVIQGKPHYVEDQQDKIINLKVPAYRSPVFQ
jgi:hypothetical protein